MSRGKCRLWEGRLLSLLHPAPVGAVTLDILSL